MNLANDNRSELVETLFDIAGSFRQLDWSVREIPTPVLEGYLASRDQLCGDARARCLQAPLSDGGWV